MHCICKHLIISLSALQNATAEQPCVALHGFSALGLNMSFRAPACNLLWQSRGPKFSAHFWGCVRALKGLALWVALAVCVACLYMHDKFRSMLAAAVPACLTAYLNLSVSLSVSLLVPLSIYLSLSLSLCLFESLFISLSLSLSISLSISLSLHLSLCFSFCLLYIYIYIECVTECSPVFFE